MDRGKEQSPGETITADVVVVGYGAAGSAAALRAAQLGASVAVLEKLPAARHTPNVRMSGGHVMAVNNAERATAYLDQCAGGMVPWAVSNAWATRASTLIDWIDGLGIDLRLGRSYGAEHPEFEGAEAIDVYVDSRQQDGSVSAPNPALTSGHAQGVALPHDPKMRTGRDLFAALADGVEKTTNIRVLWATAATRLLQDDARRVTGVQADGPEGIVTVNGRSGVILTTGGYEFDAAAKLNFLKAPDIHFYGNPANTGDGLRMAQAAGADLWHMNVMIGRAIGHFKLPDGMEVNVPILAGPPGGYVITDSRGSRFMDESRQAQGMHDVYNDLLPFDSAAGEYTRIPCFYFFDQRRMSSPLTMLSMAAVGVGLYDWSPDNQREVERGWISCADTIREAASRAGVREPDLAEEAVRAFNAACKGGSDSYRNTDLEPIVGPPYYCMPLYPGGSNTIGGPRRNERGQIVDPFGETIAGLYGAGELGSVIGALYPAGGCNLSDAFCFGQIAAESALGLLEPSISQSRKRT